MRYYIGELYTTEEVVDYINSIKDKDIDEIFEIYIENNKHIYNHPEHIYNTWRGYFEKAKNGDYAGNPHLIPEAYSKFNLMLLAVADKFYILEDDIVLVNKVKEALNDK